MHVMAQRHLFSRHRRPRNHFISWFQGCTLVQLLPQRVVGACGEGIRESHQTPAAPFYFKLRDSRKGGGAVEGTNPITHRHPNATPESLSLSLTVCVCVFIPVMHFRKLPHAPPCRFRCLMSLCMCQGVPGWGQLPRPPSGCPRVVEHGWRRTLYHIAMTRASPMALGLRPGCAWGGLQKGGPGDVSVLLPLRRVAMHLGLHFNT
jgi:hypothetical protein